MEAALGSATWLLGKVLTKLSDDPVAAYVDSLELGHNSEEIKAKLLHTQGLLHNAQGSNIGLNPGLRGLLPALSRNADQAEDLLDEVHYLQIHDKLHGTNYATTQEAGPDLVRNQALHAHSTLRHTLGFFSTFLRSLKRPQPAPVEGEQLDCKRPRIAPRDGGDDSATADGDELHFDRVSVSRKIKSVLHVMQSNCDFVSNLLGSIPSSSTAVALHRPQIGSTIIQDTLYGRRHTFEQTVDRIMSCGQTVSVLPIVGPGGIGKTTFTQHLYNDARAEKHFEVRVWVCVSTDFDVLKLTREILGCIPATEEEGSSSVANETANLDHLQKFVAYRLKSKRFLIVLDDIWKCDGEDKWKTLLSPFTKGETKGSMVLVTTRFPKLAEMMKTTETLELAGLESDDFFTFFEACIFGEHKPEHYECELAGIAGKIANKLKGSPLAAKTVGRLLQKDLSQEHWNGVLQKNEWLKQRNDYDIMPSLQISYDYLPFDLKKCFSYFGLYPEDHWFYNSEMNHLFVAIGIADSTLQVDRNYLEKLVDNGFLMKKVDSWGQYYYVMHDLMHELSKSVSAEECLNISDLDFRADAIPQSVRHLSITIENRYDENFEEEMCKLMGRIDIVNLRTLMIFRRYEKRIAKLLKDCFKEINSLRVLLIVVDSPESFPHWFSKLIHLQYLKISSSDNECEMSLPSTLSRFYHLKFLDLDDWHGSSDLPEDFSHLENLHDFCAGSKLHSNIRNVGKIKHLQRLKQFCVKKESMGFELSELGALTELEGELIICDLEHVETKEEAIAAKLKLKRNLKELILLGIGAVDADILDALQPHSNLRVLTIAYHGGIIGPSWLCLDIWLTSLETLTLESVSWSTLPPFGKIPNLKVLNLERICGISQFRCGGVPGKCFKRLKTIVLHDLPELSEWVAEPNCHSFRSLEIIKCIGCPNLCVMPFSEVSCTNLCKLEVVDCPKMSLPSMPHTSTLTDLVVERNNSEKLSYDGKSFVVSRYGGALACHNLDKVEEMSIEDAPHISLTDIEKLKSLRALRILRCDGLFPEGLDGSIVFHSVDILSLDVSHLTGKSSSKVLNCFPALSELTFISSVHPVYSLISALFGFEELEIESSDRDPDNEELLMQLPSSSSLQKLHFIFCESLVLVPVKNGGGIQEDNSLFQSLAIGGCGKIFCRWPMGEAGCQTICPFPASLRELDIEHEPSMKSMSLLSNLTSLTSLRLVECSNLTVDGFNPLITVNLEELEVTGNTVGAADLLSEVARTKLLPAGYISRLEKLKLDSISGLLVAPICNLLAPALRTLKFYEDKRAESFTDEQEKALQLLTSLQKLEFRWCKGLQSLPEGLHCFSSLKELCVSSCPKIRWMPKEGFPVSLRRLRIDHRSAEIEEQIEKFKRTNPAVFVTE